MIKKIITHLLIGCAIFLFGAVLHDFAHIRYLGNFIAYSGMAYAVLSLVVILFKGNFLEKVIEEREQNKAQDALLKYKKLLDEGILSQEEFAAKSEELKKKIL